MTYQIKTLKQHLDPTVGPKRILALDGGGLRGILTLGALSRLEALLKARHGNDPKFRLCHYFDLMAGTSTGSIIAAALALGWTVAEVEAAYFRLGAEVFRKSLFRQGLFNAKYGEEKLSDELQALFGAETTMGSSKLQTGLLIVTKRLDTGSVWPITNNPNGRYFKERISQSTGQLTIGNGDYPLWRVVRASTAAPIFFEPESFVIAEQAGRKTVQGSFVDGGASPYNNPAMMALMVATLEGYQMRWPSGADNLLLVSLGTGRGETGKGSSNTAIGHGVQSLVSLMDDCLAMQLTMLQWMSRSPTAQVIDREVGNLAGDRLGGAAMMSYLRYDADLREQAVTALLGRALPAEQMANLTAMDVPDNLKVLHAIGQKLGDRDIKPEHFGAGFDLR